MIFDIIKAINKDFSGIHPEEKFFGIAQTIEFMRAGEKIRMPSIIDFTGELKYVGIDDVNSLMVYHKLNSATVTQLTNGNGDHFGDIRNTFSIGMYVYWDTLKLKLYADQLIMLLQSRLPVTVKGLQDIKQVVIRQITANTNTLQLYGQEYLIENQLPPTKQILQINYNIEITFNSNCFRECPECV